MTALLPASQAPSMQAKSVLVLIKSPAINMLVISVVVLGLYWNELTRFTIRGTLFVVAEVPLDSCGK